MKENQEPEKQKQVDIPLIENKFSVFFNRKNDGVVTEVPIVKEEIK
jgi:hypothetical protein